MNIDNDNTSTHHIQSQPHLSIYDNGHGNPENGEIVSSSQPESSKPNSSLTHRREGLNSSATSSSIATTSSSTEASAASGSHPQSSREHSYTHGKATGPNSNQNQSNNTTPNIDKNHFLLEQQIKLTQLHQLQQLQNHIFQQQIALISGQSTSMNAVLPGSSIGGVGSMGSMDNSIPVDFNGPVALGGLGSVIPLQFLHDAQQSQNHQQNQGGELQNTSSGLLTPAPSGEIRPMDYNNAASMTNLVGSLNLQYIEPLPNSMIPSSNSSIRSSQDAQPNSNIPQRYGHRHSSSLSSASVHLQNNRHNHSHPSSPLAFNQNSTTSPTFSAMNIPASHTYHPHHSSSRQTSHLSAAHLSQCQMQAHPHSHSSSLVSTPILPPSASEKTAFRIYGDNRNGGSVHSNPHLHPSDSVHTSPHVLGSGITSINEGRGFGRVQQVLDLDQDISPLTSPWLGSTPSASGGTAVSTSVPVISHPSGLVQKASHSPAGRTSVSGNKRTASGSGDEGGGWNTGGTNSRKRPVLGSSGRIGSFSGSVGLNAATTSGSVSIEAEKGREKDTGGSTSPFTKNSTSPRSEVACSSPATFSSNVAMDRGGGGAGHLKAGSSHTPSTSQITSTVGSSMSSRRTRRGSRSTTSTPLLRGTHSTTNLLSPVGGQGQEFSSPSPVDLNSEVGQSQNGNSGGRMPPPPLPGGGMDVDVNSTEPTSPTDNSNNHLRHGMLGMTFDSMISLDEGMGMGMGVGAMVGMAGMDISGMSGMGSMDGIGGMSMEQMGVDMGMHVNMGGMGEFSSNHEHPQHHREELSIMGIDYGRDHDDEGIHLSPNARTVIDGVATSHQQHLSQSHLRPQSEFQQTRSHLSSAEAQHSRHMHLQTEQNQHQLQSQLGQSNPANQSNQQQSIMPVATPSSILNLGRLGSGSGGRLGSALSSSTSTGTASSSGGTGMVTRARKATKASKEAGSSGGAASGRRSLTASMAGTGMGAGISPGLKPLRPAVIASESLPSPALSGLVGSSASASTAEAPDVGAGSVTATPIISPADAIGVIRQPKRTHRDAEQRRRNSQKQVIDELRRLLPPIALPSDSNNGDSDHTSPSGPTSPFFFHPTATLLPGGLPPRGPPKTGGEGPNKNVSKLQVLLCGNEYIKMLKARVERRDDEIWKLRREVRKLRSLREGLYDDDFGGDEEEVDLEKDLDCVERLNTAKAASSSVQGGDGMGRGGDDEDDDDGDD